MSLTPPAPGGSQRFAPPMSARLHRNTSGPARITRAQRCATLADLGAVACERHRLAAFCARRLRKYVHPPWMAVAASVASSAGTVVKVR